MGLFKKFAGFLGLAKDEEVEHRHVGQRESTFPPSASAPNNHINRKGFSVPVQVVPADRGPILVPRSSNDGGVQGLRWFARRLKIDEDGDVADEFLEEVFPANQERMDLDHIPVTKIEVKLIARPAKVRNQVISPEGKLLHCVETQGRLQYV